MVDYIVPVIDSNRTIRIFDGLEPADLIANGTSSVKLIEDGLARPTIGIYDGKATKSVQMIPKDYQQKTEFIANLQEFDSTLGLFMNDATTNGFDIRNIPEGAEEDIYSLVVST